MLSLLRAYTEHGVVEFRTPVAVRIPPVNIGDATSDIESTARYRVRINGQ